MRFYTVLIVSCSILSSCSSSNYLHQLMSKRAFTQDLNELPSEEPVEPLATVAHNSPKQINDVQQNKFTRRLSDIPPEQLTKKQLTNRKYQLQFTKENASKIIETLPAGKREAFIEKVQRYHERGRRSVNNWQERLKEKIKTGQATEKDKSRWKNWHKSANQRERDGQTGMTRKKKVNKPLLHPALKTPIVKTPAQPKLKESNIPLIDEDERKMNLQAANQAVMSQLGPVPKFLSKPMRQ